MTANRRLTAAARAALLAAIAAELATLANLGALLSVHVFVGVLMAGPLAVKLASTGWRFVRYYAGSPAYVREGPPPLALRMLAPLLVASTLAVVGTGFALVVTGPAHPVPFVALHLGAPRSYHRLLGQPPPAPPGIQPRCRSFPDRMGIS